MSGEKFISLPEEITSGVVLNNPAPFVSIKFVHLAQLSVREGAWCELSDRKKQIITLRLVDGLTDAQIADEIGIRRRSVNKHINQVPGMMFEKIQRKLKNSKDNIATKTDKVGELVFAYEAYKNSLTHNRKVKV